MIEPVFWGVGARRGDGRPVLVPPGLYGGDRYLGPLRDWLRRRRLQPRRFGLTFNPGVYRALADAIPAADREVI